MKKVIFLLLLSGIFAHVSAQDQSIKRIFDNPGRFTGELVDIQGRVTQYVPASTTTTAFYYIADDFAAEIMVQASVSGAPETNEKYKVRGYFNIIGSEYVIQEISREPLRAPGAAKATPEDEEARAQRQMQLEREEQLRKEHEEKLRKEKEEAQKKQNTMLYVIIGLAFVFLVVIILLFVRKKQTAAPMAATNEMYPPTQMVNQAPPTVTTRIASEGFTTVRFESAPKTMRFIPGKFTITSQEDNGKSFQIAGYPSGGDSIITIGREDVKGERSYAHIKIDDKFKTVSRKQAEFVYSQKTLWVVNKSESNYTQIDGYELKPGEKKEVQNGSVIRMGELELKYTA